MNGTQEVHEECIVHTGACQKAHLRLKQSRTVKKLSELHLSEGISQPVEIPLNNSLKIL